MIDDLKQTMLADGLDEQELRKLAEIAESKTFYKNDVIFHENETEDSIYLLLEGKVAIERRVLPNQKVSIKHIQNVRRGQLFGEMGFLERRSRSATARAKSTVRVIRFRFDDFEQLIQFDKELGVKLLRTIGELLCRRLRRMNDQWLRTVSEGAELQEFEYF